ncbi:hypothetical protein GCM10022267_31150 [Lentzea roselyniae]|uniref:Neocarzinostatin family protein n=1 Tax=Lentzea roselyniae TaxID=531940 RepID=A0ABP7AWD3_9PSEU
MNPLAIVLRALLSALVIAAGLLMAPSAGFADVLPDRSVQTVDPDGTSRIPCDRTVDGVSTTTTIKCSALFAYDVMGTVSDVRLVAAACRVTATVPAHGTTAAFGCAGSGPLGHLTVDLATLAVEAPPSGGNCSAVVDTPFGAVSAGGGGGALSVDVDPGKQEASISAAGGVGINVLGVSYSCGGPVKITVDLGGPTTNVPSGCTPL